MNFSAWGTGQKIDEIAGNNSELNTPSQDGCPIQSPRRAQPLHGLELTVPGGRDSPRHLGLRSEHERSWAPCSQNTRRAGQIGRRRLLSDPRPGGGHLRDQGAPPGAAGWATSTSPATIQRRGWTEPRGSRLRSGGPNSARRTGPSYVKGRKGGVPLLLVELCDRPGRHLCQQEAGGRGLRLLAVPKCGRAERCGSERHPAERAEGRQ